MAAFSRNLRPLAAGRQNAAHFLPCAPRPEDWRRSAESPLRCWWLRAGGGNTRTVEIPSGKWKADDGTVIIGPVQRTFDVPLGRLLYFERHKRP
jgi:hypothetical protein